MNINGVHNIPIRMIQAAEGRVMELRQIEPERLTHMLTEDDI
jgi:hypothetical protein